MQISRFLVLKKLNFDTKFITASRPYVNSARVFMASASESSAGILCLEYFKEDSMTEYKRIPRTHSDTRISPLALKITSPATPKNK